MGSAFFLWLAAVFATVILFLLSKSFLDSHVWASLLIVDSTWVFGSFLLLARDKITLHEAGVSVPRRSISWSLNLTILLGVQLTASAVLFAMNAPDSFVSSFSFGQRLLWDMRSSSYIGRILSEGLVSNGIYENSSERRGDFRHSCKRGILRVDAPICEYFPREDDRNGCGGVSQRIGLCEGSTSVRKFTAIYPDACCLQCFGMVDGKAALDSDRENERLSRRFRHHGCRKQAISPTTEKYAVRAK